MPELPEVESFRRLLLPLVSTSTALGIELTAVDANADGSRKPLRNVVRQEEVQHLSHHVYLVDVQRKGKLMCMILQGMGAKDNLPNLDPNPKLEYFYLFLHMGMTGRISTPDRVLSLKSLERSADGGGQVSEEYPPKHTFIKFQSGCYEACFSDPRRFGWVAFKSSLERGFDELAPDALSLLTGTSSSFSTTANNTEDALQTIIPQLEDQRLAIKTLLMDQKRVMSGIGNWIADEVLYQAMVHPEQTHLSETQVTEVLDKLKNILVTAIDCLVRGDDFPSDWIFHVRWRKSKSPITVKDSRGRVVEFLVSRARTAAIVPSIQKLKKGSSKTIKTDDAPDRKASKSVGVGDKGKGKASVKGENIPVQTADQEDTFKKVSSIRNSATSRKRKTLAHPIRSSKRGIPKT
jgi:formamidopyrimidine-DNA glycosylase